MFYFKRPPSPRRHDSDVLCVRLPLKAVRLCSLYSRDPYLFFIKVVSRASKPDDTLVRANCGLPSCDFKEQLSANTLFYAIVVSILDSESSKWTRSDLNSETYYCMITWYENFEKIL